MSEKTKIRVLIVDDHPVVRNGIERLLRETGQFEIVGQAADGREGVEKAMATKPDVVLMDLCMPDFGGLEAIRALMAKEQEIAILVLTISEYDKDLFAAIKAGARGYLLKTVEIDELIHGIELIASGQVAISPVMAGKMLDEFTKRVPCAVPKKTGRDDDALTERELEILTLVARGASNREIAEMLVIAENTVRTHLQNVLHKLHCRNRTQAAMHALNEGLISQQAPSP